MRPTVLDSYLSVVNATASLHTTFRQLAILFPHRTLQCVAERIGELRRLLYIAHQGAPATAYSYQLTLCQKHLNRPGS